MCLGLSQVAAQEFINEQATFLNRRVVRSTYQANTPR
jgi:hypothetical protein